MKERQRWRAEEDALLRAYVKQYGPREWHLVSQRMNTTLNRDAKSCLERWKNYLKPGIKKGSLTEEEQHLVIQLQAKHGNKWKKIAAEIPGRTAKRLGKWWEVFKDKQQREQKDNNVSSHSHTIDEGKYDQILETFAEKIVERSAPAFGFLHTESPPLLRPWISNSNGSPSVTLSLSSTIAASPPIPWLHPSHGETMMMAELIECCREVEEGHRAWAAHKKEASWRLNRLELQIESEKANRRRDKTEEIESKIKALREEQESTLERIEAEYREQFLRLRSHAEAKEMNFTDHLVIDQRRLSKLVDQIKHQ